MASGETQILNSNSKTGVQDPRFLGIFGILVRFFGGVISGGSRISQIGRRQPLRLGQIPIIWQDFYRKLHENERNWTEGGGGVPGAPLGSANSNSSLNNTF